MARDRLDAAGYGSTVDYLVAMCGLVLSETGLLPHANAGQALSAGELARLRGVSASQGMMIESLNAGLDCHRGAPDKTPARRLATLEAGRARNPVHHGILVGIGESRGERVEAWRRSGEPPRARARTRGDRQNFLPGGIGHGRRPRPPEEQVWTVALPASS